MLPIVFRPGKPIARRACSSEHRRRSTRSSVPAFPRLPLEGEPTTSWCRLAIPADSGEGVHDSDLTRDSQQKSFGGRDRSLSTVGAARRQPAKAGEWRVKMPQP
jgi:hypothetical protein